LVQSLDFITPIVDDAFTFGQIAAANALSDIFAMNARVTTALNILGFDDKHLPKELIKDILEGGNSKIKECGGVLLGGHSICSPEMYYGLSVTGLANPSKILRNNTGKIGDLLILTKPLGMGIISTALKNEKLQQAQIKEACKIMSNLNFHTSKHMRDFKISACTDITGFGFLGHAYEMTNDKISLSIDANLVPCLDLARTWAKKEQIPGGTKRNQDYFGKNISFSQKLQNSNDFAELKALLFDAQTSGGLLFSIDKNQAKEFLSKIQDSSLGYAQVIGEITPRKQKAIMLN